MITEVFAKNPNPANVEAKRCRGFAEPAPPVLIATNANEASVWRHRNGVCHVLRLERAEIILGGLQKG